MNLLNTNHHFDVSKNKLPASQMAIIKDEAIKLNMRCMLTLSEEKSALTGRNSNDQSINK